jgi:hypothetical protein
MASNFRIFVNFKQHRRASIIAIILPLFSFVLIMALTVVIIMLFKLTPNEKEGEYALVLMITFYGTLSFTSFYINIAIAVRNRFKTINNLLKTKLSSSHNLKINQKNDLKTLSSLHAQLCDIISMTNKIFSLPHAYFLLINLVSCVFTLYEGYAIIASSQIILARIGFLIQSLIITGHYHFFVLTPLMASTMMTSEGRKAAEVLAKIRAGKGLRKNFVVLRQQLRHSNVTFSCGLFEFDWTLMHAVSGKMIIFYLYDFFLYINEISIKHFNFNFLVLRFSDVIFGDFNSVRCDA